MTETGREHVDPVGARTLEALQAAGRYAAWQVEQVAEFLGSRILEVGAGIGNISAHLVAAQPGALFVSDRNDQYLSRLRRAFAAEAGVRVVRLALPGIDVDKWATERIDTIVAFNVIEHIEDDITAVGELAATLVPGGRLLLIVPAHELLYSDLDMALGHYRRYSVHSVSQLLYNAGLRPLRIRYFNMAGAVGWFLRGQIRGKRELAASSLRLFDWLVPILKLEDVMPRPFGLSVVAVAEK